MRSCSIIRIVPIAIAVVLCTGRFANAVSFTFTPIDVPGATETQALGINDSGNVVGVYHDATGGHGFLAVGGSFTPIDVPGATLFGTGAAGINGPGNIVGFYFDGAGPHGFLDVGGSITPINVPGAISTNTTSGINDLGNIVGQIQTARESRSASWTWAEASPPLTFREPR
jgi:hypothetical protein